MGKKQAALVLSLVMAATALCARLLSAAGVSFTFASVAEGQRVLMSHDEYVGRMTPLDRSLRMMTSDDVSVTQFLDFVGRNVVEWTYAEREKVKSALPRVRKAIEELALPLPERILLIKTTGYEEGGAPYTRANAIILSRYCLELPEAEIELILAHELFHVLSRANPGLRDRLYAAIGFEKCGDVAFPPEFRERRLTNPDAPRNEHCIVLTVDGEERWAVPILFSPVAEYSPAYGRNLFNYFHREWLLVQRAEDGSLADRQEPVLVSFEDASGLFEQVGSNSGYTMHPEELMADNFELLVLGERDVPSPEILERIEAILRSAAADLAP